MPVAAGKDLNMSTVTDVDMEQLRAKAAAEAQRLREQMNDPEVILAGMQEMFRQIHAGEVEYGVPWQEAHRAVRSGQIYETFEVCSWLMAINRLKRIIAES
jgi:hypothetical protein